MKRLLHYLHRSHPAEDKAVCHCDALRSERDGVEEYNRFRRYAAPLHITLISLMANLERTDKEGDTAKDKTPAICWQFRDTVIEGDYVQTKIQFDIHPLVEFPMRVKAEYSIRLGFLRQEGAEEARSLLHRHIVERPPAIHSLDKWLAQQVWNILSILLIHLSSSPLSLPRKLLCIDLWQPPDIPPEMPDAESVEKTEHE